MAVVGTKPKGCGVRLVRGDVFCRSHTSSELRGPHHDGSEAVPLGVEDTFRTDPTAPGGLTVAGV